jgi:hypothetical protein
VDRRSVIASLKALRMDLEQDRIDLATDLPEAALMLSDVCIYLGLSEAEQEEVLGSRVGDQRNAQLTEKGILTADRLIAEKETATIPPVELAAVPV